MAAIRSARSRTTRNAPTAATMAASRITYQTVMRARIGSLTARPPARSRRRGSGALERLLELAAQVADVYVHDVRRPFEVLVPDVVEDRRAGDRLPGVPGQVLEDGELARCEGHGHAGARHLVRRGIDDQVADLQANGPRAGGAAHERAQPRQQLAEV